MLSFLCTLFTTGGLFNNANFGTILGLLFVFCLSAVPFAFFLCAFFDTPQTSGQATLAILLGTIQFCSSFQNLFHYKKNISINMSNFLYVMLFNIVLWLCYGLCTLYLVFDIVVVFFSFSVVVVLQSLTSWVSVRRILYRVCGGLRCEYVLGVLRLSSSGLLSLPTHGSPDCLRGLPEIVRRHLHRDNRRNHG